MPEPLITPSARRHGTSDEDVRHAWRNAGYAEEVGDGMTMLVGPDRAGKLMEVGVVEARDPATDETIVHAMPARAPWAAKYWEQTR